MMRHLALSIWCGAILLSLVSLATAQRPGRVGTPPADVPPPVPAGVEPPGAGTGDKGTPAEAGAPTAPGGALRDPTTPSAKMRDVLNTKGAAGRKISPMSLRGRVIARGQPAAALLEVEGRLYTVSKGSVITGASNTVLRILDIDATGVRVESSPSKEIFLLR